MKNPVNLLIKFQHKERLTPTETETLWLFLSDYVRRCERNHFGSTDRPGAHDDVHTERVLFLCDMLRSYRDVTTQLHPYTNHKGKLKYAKACKLDAPLRHPNLTLTCFRLVFPNIETLFRLKQLGVYTKTWGVYDVCAKFTDFKLYGDILKRVRVLNTYDAHTIYRAWLDENQHTTEYRRNQYKTYLSKCMYFLNYGSALSLTDVNGNDRSAYCKTSEVF